MQNKLNPRGLKRPRDGRGRGVGIQGGRRAGRNKSGCSKGGPGHGRGCGKGNGQNRLG